MTQRLSCSIHLDKKDGNGRLRERSDEQEDRIQGVPGDQDEALGAQAADDEGRRVVLRRVRQLRRRHPVLDPQIGPAREMTITAVTHPFGHCARRAPPRPLTLPRP